MWVCSWYYCRERLYSQISLKVWDSEEKLAFLSRLPLRRDAILYDPGIVVSFYASAHHPHTTKAIDEWTIFWLSEDSPVEVGSTECSRHLVSESSARFATSNLTIRATCNGNVVRHFSVTGLMGTIMTETVGPRTGTLLWKWLMFVWESWLSH